MKFIYKNIYKYYKNNYKGFNICRFIWDRNLKLFIFKNVKYTKNILLVF